MQCHELAALLEKIQPDASSRDIARLCLLLANGSEKLDQFADPARLREAWRDASLRLQAGAEQHEAMTRELETLARSDPKKFSPDQIWILVRAIKVQSQILEMYLGQPALDV
jgi:hypothetical protein